MSAVSLRDRFWSVMPNSSREFAWLWTAQGISLLGDQLYLLALPLLIYDVTRSGSKMAFAFAIEMAPYLLLGMVGGVLSDGWGRKRTMVLGNLMAAVPLCGVFLLFSTGHLRVWHIYVASLVLSSVVAGTMPAFEASIPSLVDKSELGRANSLMEMSSSGALMAGPLLAAVLIGIIGPGPAILIDAVSFVLAAGIIIRIRFGPEAAVSSSSRRAVFGAMLEGLAYVPKHEVLRWGMLMSTSANLVMGAYRAMLLFHLRDRLGIAVAMIGVMFSFSNIIPFVVSGAVASVLSKRSGAGPVMLFSLALQGIAVLYLGLATGIAGIAVAQGLYTGAITLYNINWRTLRQEITPPSMLGRVSGACRGVAYSGASMGGWIGAILLTKYVPANLFVGNGLAIFAISFLALLSPLRLYPAASTATALPQQQ